MARRRKIVYSPELEVERRESFVSTKIGKDVTGIKQLIEGLPASIKWLFAVLVRGIVSGVVALVFTFYFDFGFRSIEELNLAIRLQFVIDLALFAMMAVFILLLIREARQ